MAELEEELFKGERECKQNISSFVKKKKNIHTASWLPNLLCKIDVHSSNLQVGIDPFRSSLEVFMEKFIHQIIQQIYRKTPMQKNYFRKS